MVVYINMWARVHTAVDLHFTVRVFYFNVLKWNVDRPTVTTIMAKIQHKIFRLLLKHSNPEMNIEQQIFVRKNPANKSNLLEVNEWNEQSFFIINVRVEKKTYNNGVKERASLFVIWRRKNGVKKKWFSPIDRTNSIQLNVQFIYWNEWRSNNGKQYSLHTSRMRPKYCLE